jgi:hypothetical protein
MKDHLGIYSNWIEAANRRASLYPLASPGEETRRQIRTILGFSNAPPVAEDAQIEATWKRDGLADAALRSCRRPATISEQRLWSG